MKIVGTEDSSTLVANKHINLGRGTREYILSKRDALLSNRNFIVPEDWDREWNIHLGPIWTPGLLSEVKCWLSPENLHLWDITSSQGSTFNPPDATAVDRTITSSGTQSVTANTINVGSHYNNRNRGILVWDLTALPSTTTIQTATITLKYSSDNTSGEKVVKGYRITQAGVDESVSWATYDGSSSWTTAGGDYSVTNGLSQTIDCDGGGDFVDSSSDFVALVQDAVDNQSGYLRMIFATEEEIDGPAAGAQRIKFHSSSASSSANYPKIVLTYTDSAKNNRIYQADDRSGNGIKFQQNDDSAYLPTNATTTLSTFTGVKFDGANDFLEDDSHAGDQEFDVGTGDYALALMVDIGTDTNSADYIISKGEDRSGWAISVDTSSSATSVKHHIGSTTTTATSCWASNNDKLIILCERDGGYNKIHVNGTLKTTSVAQQLSDVDTTENVLLAALVDSGAHTNHWNGSIYEVVFHNGTLSDANKENIEGYLAHKFNQESLLPSGHTYKTNPPRSRIVL